MSTYKFPTHPDPDHECAWKYAVPLTSRGSLNRQSARVGTLDGIRQTRTRQAGANVHPRAILRRIIGR